MQIAIKKITFDEIYPIWKQHLWPSRSSPIKSHSSMTLDRKIDMEIYNYPVTFVAAVVNNKIIGVNSGHRSSSTTYRSRGLWVDTVYRKKGIGKQLLLETEHQAVIEECDTLWSIPRVSALRTYISAGFKTIGDSLQTETSDSNIYACKKLK